MSPSEIGDRRSESDQEKIERLLMPVEFQGLEDLEAVINIAGFGISKINIPKIFFKERHSNFIMRKFNEVDIFNHSEIVEPMEENILRREQENEEEQADTKIEESTQAFNI